MYFSRTMQNHILQLLQQHGFVVEESGAEFACSPDLSPIENIWCTIKPQIHQRRPQTLQQLETFLFFFFIFFFPFLRLYSKWSIVWGLNFFYFISSSLPSCKSCIFLNTLSSCSVYPVVICMLCMYGQVDG